MTDRVCVARHSREIDRRVKCSRPAVVEFGLVALCEAHLVVLESGREFKAAYGALAHVRRWLTEPKGQATTLLEPELEKLLASLEREHYTAYESHRHFLRQAGDIE